jgi:hypothetical protein
VRGCFKRGHLVKIKLKLNLRKEAVVGIVPEESNDYFATRYWDLKKATIIALSIPGSEKK